MIASVLTLTREECKKQKITDAYSIHRVIYSLFPKQEERARDFLFADLGGDFNSRKILILSHREPLIPQWGKIEIKNIPKTFLEHDLYGFEVNLNPTKRDKNSGKIVPIRGEENLIKWFCEKSEKLYGFQVLKHQNQNLLEVREMKIKQFSKGDHNVILNSVTFIGQLKVVDRNLFRKAFEFGIGRAKGFGFGLLQLIPLTNKS